MNDKRYTIKTYVKFTLIRNTNFYGANMNTTYFGNSRLKTILNC